MGSRYVGECEGKLSKLANSAEKRPHVLHLFFFDEFDSYAMKRTSQASGFCSRSEIMVCSPGVNEA